MLPYIDSLNASQLYIYFCEIIANRCEIYEK